MKFYPAHVRSRLTLWYMLFLSLILLAHIAAAVSLLSWHLNSQLFHDEIQDLETVEGLLYFTPAGQLQLHEDYHSHPQSRQVLERYMEVLTPEGEVLYKNERLEGLDLGGPARMSEGANSYDKTTTRLSDGTPVLFVSHLHVMNSRPLILRVGYNLSPLRATVAESAGTLFLAFPFGIGLAGLAGYYLARRVLDPLAKMSTQADLITATNLDQRLPVENSNDELGQIAQILNRLLARLEEAFSQLRSFTSNVSHELRTPLAAIRSVGEVGLQNERTPAEYRDIIGSMLEEVSRLTDTVETLLIISRADAGQIQLHATQFEFSTLIEEAADLVQILAEEKKQELKVSVVQSVQVVADRLLLRLAIVNILHNAVRYSPEHAPISVSVSQVSEPSNEQTWVQCDVVDSGPGIPDGEQSKVFERFYRVDAARSREHGGAGLGLAIAKWAVEINGGHIGVQSTERGSCRFFIRMPALQLS